MGGFGAVAKRPPYFYQFYEKYTKFVRGLA